MKNYKWNDLQIGISESFQVVITEEMFQQFTNLTGDRNPLHIDKKYAQARGYQDKVVYGMLTASFYSTLAGMYLPGKYCVLQECNVSFHKPVFAGDMLSVMGKVVELHDVFHRVTIKADIKNQYNQRVSKATIVAGVLEDEI